MTQFSVQYKGISNFTEAKRPEIFSTIAHLVNNSCAVVLNWTTVEDAISYTVFWCKGSYNNHECSVCHLFRNCLLNSYASARLIGRRLAEIVYDVISSADKII